MFFGTAMLVLGSYAFANRRRLAAAASLRQRVGDNAPVVVQANILAICGAAASRRSTGCSTRCRSTSAVEFELRRAGAAWTVGEFLLGSAVTASLLMLLGQQCGPLSWPGLRAILGAFAAVRCASATCESAPQEIRGSASRGDRHDRERDAGWIFLPGRAEVRG